jgi:uncharacterized delta-60 repeat protein
MGLGGIAALALVLVLQSGTAGAAAGDLDPAFGAGGIVSTLPSGTADSPLLGLDALLVQPDGRILAGGFAADPGPDQTTHFAVARFLRDGALDPAFGGGGTAELGEDDLAAVSSLALARNGRLVAGGVALGPPPGLRIPGFGLARFEGDGDPDPSFGDDGAVASFFASGLVGGGSAARDVVALADGSVVAVGSIAQGSGPGPTRPTFSGFAVARYLADGSLDPSFGGDGLVEVTSLTGEGTAQTARELPGGTIAFAGLHPSPLGMEPSDAVFLARLGRAGDFQGDRVVSPFPGDASRVRLLASGMLMAVGSRELGNPGSSAWVVARYLPDGSPDPSFGAGGSVETDPGPGVDRLVDVVLDRRGRVVVAGCIACAHEPAFAPSGFAVARYTAAGALDASFGTGGIVRIPIGDEAQVGALAIDAQDRILVGGETVAGDASGVAIVRLLAESLPPRVGIHFAPVTPRGRSVGAFRPR